MSAGLHVVYRQDEEQNSLEGKVLEGVPKKVVALEEYIL